MSNQTASGKEEVGKRLQFDIDKTLTKEYDDFCVTSKETIIGSITLHKRNKTTFNFNENNNLTFKTSENLDKNITEYYNLIYEYKNDCLAAAIEYDKQYYSDESLKPEENILFSIKIIPFGNIKTPSITKSKGI